MTTIPPRPSFRRKPESRNLWNCIANFEKTLLTPTPPSLAGVAISPASEGLSAMTVAKMKSLLENDSVKAAANARAEGYATPLAEMFIKAAYAGILFDGRLARRTGKLVMEIAYTEACAVARAKRDVACAEVRHLREMLLRIGIDPDTGERLPHFNYAYAAAAGQAEK